MMQYIYDFLSVLFDKLKERDKIRRIILFGSFARGNARKDSDIDLFIDVKEENKEEVSILVKETLNEFELRAMKTWYIKGIKNPIMPIVDSLDADKWSELKSEIAVYSIVLFGSSEMKRDVLGKQKVIIEYDISKSKQKDKMKIIRKLYGYKNKKGKKIYFKKGITDEIKGEKINNAVIADIKEYKPVIKLLRANKIPFKIRLFWIE
ncbi:MAG: nucleotidyltransferase domain-containing protein [Nanoarchaeota archaeon]